MITGDNEHAARVIALECGIPNLDENFKNEAVVEEFSKNTHRKKELPV